MREYPILFSAPMIRALLADRKHVTRRLSNQWLKVKAGDRLWVRETWTFINMSTEDNRVCIAYNADGPGLPYRPDIRVTPETINRFWNGRDPWQHRKRPSIHMPRWASRILLECEEDARLERLWDITEEEAQAEGFDTMERFDVYTGQYGFLQQSRTTWSRRHRPNDPGYPCARRSFAEIWSELHTKLGERWEDNPEVVRVGRFRRVEAGI